MKDKIEVVAFDADDTLWENELYFQEFEHKFCDLLKTYQPPAAISQELFKTEMKNLHMYGYGLKSMMLRRKPCPISRMLLPSPAVCADLYKRITESSANIVIVAEKKLI